MNDDDVADLLAAYALDALDDDERAVVDDLLARSPAPHALLAQFQAVADLLAEAPDDELPPGSWDRLAARLDDAPPLGLAHVRALRPDRPSRRRAARAARLTAAAAAVAAVGLGALALSRREQIDEAGPVALSRVAAQALTQPGSRAGVLASNDGTLQVRVVIGSDGQAFVFADALPPLRAGQTYQLWTLDAPQPVSLGVLGARPGVVAFAAPGVHRVAITAEDAPGAPAPTAAPLVSGTLA